MADVSVLEVLLYGEPVGTLILVPGDRSLFAFNEDYIANEERPVLSLGFKDSFGQLITEFRPYGLRVMPFFSNLLPEGRMRDSHNIEKSQTVTSTPDIHVSTISS